jgi:hypothetical protein
MIQAALILVPRAIIVLAAIIERVNRNSSVSHVVWIEKNKEMHVELWQNLLERFHMGDEEGNERIILIWMLWTAVVRTGCRWNCTEFSRMAAFGINGGVAS